MPGWHAGTKALEEAGKVRTVGLIQEQHPDRCALFMQWKRMDFPIMVDPLNLLGVSAVPITLFIDEAGVVRAINPRSTDALEEFVSAAPATPEPGNAQEFDASAIGDRGDTLDPVRRKALRNAMAGVGNPDFRDNAIGLLGSVTKNDPDDAASHFRRGVMYRMRYDSEHRKAGDFAKAVAHWARALELDPNQYIWRRRIQQYGPRLDKPYPFYDWVATAREEIRARGEEPVAIAVEPSGSEFAQPMRQWAQSEAAAEEPDPERRIIRDTKGLIEIESVVVPATTSRGGAAYRVHVLMRANAKLDAHWNNEVEPTVVWFDPPEGWAVDQRLVSPPMPSGSAVSDELRRVEAEVRDGEAGVDGGEASGPRKLGGHVLYYVCEGADGTCLYLRQDFEIALP